MHADNGRMTLAAMPPVPRRAYLELTARCDLQCLHCAGAMHQRDKGDMDYAFYLRLAATLRRLGVEELALAYFGEPFLCRWLPEAIHHAKQTLGFPRVLLETNGRLATPERVRDSIEAGLDRLEFAVNWTGPDDFHYITGAPEHDFWKVEVNLMAARMVRDEVKARTGHHCEIVASTLRFDGEQPARMERALTRVRNAADKHYWKPLRGPLGLACGAAREPRPCRSLFEEAHVTYDGRLSACAFDHDARFHMGDLSCETFLEAWHGERFARLREAHLANDLSGTPCQGCTAWQ